jgi:filamentous hemagglutinin
MAAGVLQAPDGSYVSVVSTSEPGGYLRPGVTVNSDEVVISGTGHAEADIVNWAEQNGYRVVTIGAGRPICPSCAGAIAGSGGSPATPLK